jgi:hypothetical protein
MERRRAEPHRHPPLPYRPAVTRPAAARRFAPRNTAPGVTCASRHIAEAWHCSPDDPPDPDVFRGPRPATGA